MKEKLSFRKNLNESPELSFDEKDSYEEFMTFYSARPDQHEIITQLISQIENSNTVKSYLIREH